MPHDHSFTLIDWSNAPGVQTNLSRWIPAGAAAIARPARARGHRAENSAASSTDSAPQYNRQWHEA